MKPIELTHEVGVLPGQGADDSSLVKGEVTVDVDVVLRVSDVAIRLLKLRGLQQDVRRGHLERHAD